MLPDIKRFSSQNFPTPPVEIKQKKEDEYSPLLTKIFSLKEKYLELDKDTTKFKTNLSDCFLITSDLPQIESKLKLITSYSKIHSSFHNTLKLEMEELRQEVSKSDLSTNEDQPKGLSLEELTEFNEILKGEVTEEIYDSTSRSSSLNGQQYVREDFLHYAWHELVYLHLKSLEKVFLLKQYLRFIPLLKDDAKLILKVEKLKSSAFKENFKLLTLFKKIFAFDLSFEEDFEGLKEMISFKVKNLAILTEPLDDIKLHQISMFEILKDIKTLLGDGSKDEEIVKNLQQDRLSEKFVIFFKDNKVNRAKMINSFSNLGKDFRSKYYMIQSQIIDFELEKIFTPIAIFLIKSYEQINILLQKNEPSSQIAAKEKFEILNSIMDTQFEDWSQLSTSFFAYGETLFTRIKELSTALSDYPEEFKLLENRSDRFENTFKNLEEVYKKCLVKLQKIKDEFLTLPFTNEN